MEPNKIFISQFRPTEDENIFTIGFTHYCPFDEKHGLNYDKRNNKLMYKYFEIKEDDLLHHESLEQKEFRELKQKMEEQEQAILELTSMVMGGTN
ncbi:hypothetical protein [Clostridium senegalense]